MREQRNLEHHGAEECHRGRGVKSAAPDLDEGLALSNARPEREQRGEAAHHEGRQEGAGTEIAEDHFV